MARMVAELGRRDPQFVVTNADGNEASNMKAINEVLKIRHPTEDALYNQSPDGQVYEPLSEDACAGLAAGLALFGGRSLWLSYESFAINGWPIVQTVGQAMAELRRKTPAVVTMFTAGALEQGRNGWTHQRPEIENYIGGQMRNGNVYLLYPGDANMIQAAYGWSVEQSNKCISIIASKSALPVHTTMEQAEQAIEQGAIVLSESAQGERGTVVFAVTGDMIFGPVFEAKEQLEAKITATAKGSKSAWPICRAARPSAAETTGAAPLTISTMQPSITSMRSCGCSMGNAWPGSKI